MKTCPYCAEEIQDAAIVCKHCGRELGGGGSEQAPPAQRPPTTAAAKGRGTDVLAAGAVILGFLVLAAWCAGANKDRGESTRPVTVETIERDRTEAFQRAITGVGDSCPSITETYFQGQQDRSGTKFWSVRCSDGKTYSIAVARDSSYKVLSCKTLEAIARVKCFTKLE